MAAPDPERLSHISERTLEEAGSSSTELTKSREASSHEKQKRGWFSWLFDKTAKSSGSDDIPPERREALREDAKDRETTLMSVLKNVKDHDKVEKDNDAKKQQQQQQPQQPKKGFTFFGIKSKSKEDVLSSDTKLHGDKIYEAKDNKAKSLETLNQGGARMGGLWSWFTKSKERVDKRLPQENNDSNKEFVEIDLGEKGELNAAVSDSEITIKKLDSPAWATRELGTSIDTEKKASVSMDELVVKKESSADIGPTVPSKSTHSDIDQDVADSSKSFGFGRLFKLPSWSSKKKVNVTDEEKAVDTVDKGKDDQVQSDETSARMNKDEHIKNATERKPGETERNKLFGIKLPHFGGSAKDAQFNTRADADVPEPRLEEAKVHARNAAAEPEVKVLNASDEVTKASVRTSSPASGPTRRSPAPEVGGDAIIIPKRGEVARAASPEQQNNREIVEILSRAEVNTTSHENDDAVGGKLKAPAWLRPRSADRVGEDETKNAPDEQMRQRKKPAENFKGGKVQEDEAKKSLDHEGGMKHLASAQTQWERKKSSKSEESSSATTSRSRSEEPSKVPRVKAPAWDRTKSSDREMIDPEESPSCDAYATIGAEPPPLPPKPESEVGRSRLRVHLYSKIDPNRKTRKSESDLRMNDGDASGADVEKATKYHSIKSWQVRKGSSDAKSHTKSETDLSETATSQAKPLPQCKPTTIGSTDDILAHHERENPTGFAKLKRPAFARTISPPPRDHARKISGPASLPHSVTLADPRADDGRSKDAEGSSSARTKLKMPAFAKRTVSPVSRPSKSTPNEELKAQLTKMKRRNSRERTATRKKSNDVELADDFTQVRIAGFGVERLEPKMKASPKTGNQNKDDQEKSDMPKKRLPQSREVREDDTERIMMIEKEIEIPKTRRLTRESPVRPTSSINNDTSGYFSDHHQSNLDGPEKEREAGGTRGRRFGDHNFMNFLRATGGKVESYGEPTGGRTRHLGAVEKKKKAATATTSRGKQQSPEKWKGDKIDNNVETNSSEESDPVLRQVKGNHCTYTRP